MVEKESYLSELSRYVVLNPVRAGMVADAADYPWSSYPAMLARSDLHPPAPHDAWLETDFVLRQFGTGRRRAVAGYIDFVGAGVGLPSVWESLRGQVFLGSDAFVEAMTRELGMDVAIADAFGVHEAKVSRALRRAKGNGLSKERVL